MVVGFSATDFDGMMEQDPIATTAFKRRASLRQVKRKVEVFAGKIESVWSVLTEHEKLILARYSVWQLPGIDSPTIEGVFDALTTYLGVEPDDHETWTDEMEVLFAFRRFKKAGKCRSTLHSWKGGERICLD